MNNETVEMVKEEMKGLRSSTRAIMEVLLELASKYGELQADLSAFEEAVIEETDGSELLNDTETVEDFAILSDDSDEDSEDKTKQETVPARIRLSDIETKIITAWYFSTDEDWPYRKKPTQQEMASLLNRDSRAIRHLIDRLKKMPSKTKDAVLSKIKPLIGSTSNGWKKEEDEELLNHYAIPAAERPRIEVLTKRINRSAKAIYARKYMLTHSPKGEANAD